MLQSFMKWPRLILGPRLARIQQFGAVSGYCWVMSETWNSQQATAIDGDAEHAVSMWNP
jgi:hypothetical protein